MKRFFVRAMRDARGATVIEYALIAGFLALGIVGALTAVGQNVSSLLMNAAACFH